jgi:pSer/pThr/pTyr-binding forkhead associated (FHA) protein
MTTMPTTTHQAVTDRHDALPALDQSVRRQAVEPEDPAPGRYLVVQEGEVERLVPLDAEVIRIGRGFSAELRLDDPTVSRRHAIVAALAGGRVRILDDRSANGTFVNGRSVLEAELADGDLIRLGSVSMGYREVSA